MAIKNKSYKFALLFFILLTISCKPQPNQKDLSDDALVEISLPYPIELEDILKKKGNVLLSEIATEIVYIPLETHDKSLVNKIDRVCYWDDHIIIGEFRKLHLFDKSGHFIKNISREGGGPGEFNRISCVLSDPDNNNLYLFDRRTFLKFDKYVNFLGKYPLEGILFNKGLLTEDKTFLFYVPNDVFIEGDTTTVNSLIELDTLGNIIRYHKNENPRYKKTGISILFPSAPLYSYKNDIRFKELGSDTLFTILKDKKEPYAILKLGDKKIDYSISYSSLEEGERVIARMHSKLHIINILEDDSFIYIFLSQGLEDDYVYCTFSKLTRKPVSLENDGFTNNIDGGLPFFPKWIDEKSGDRIMVKSAEEFKEEILSLDYDTQYAIYGDQFQKVYDLAQSLQEDDNPVLIIVR